MNRPIVATGNLIEIVFVWCMYGCGESVQMYNIVRPWPYRHGLSVNICIVGNHFLDFFQGCSIHWVNVS